jgi:hypothetical protein
MQRAMQGIVDRNIGDKKLKGNVLVNLEYIYFLKKFRTRPHKQTCA